MTTDQTGGYNTELFVSEINESFKCSICHDVLKDSVEVIKYVHATSSYICPLKLRCEGHHVFCKSCIIEALNRKGSCPNCREEIRKTSNGDWIYDLPRHYFRNAIDGLRLECDIDGCDYISTIGEYQAHQSTCQFNQKRQVKCKGCNAEMYAFKLHRHDCGTNLVEQNKDIEGICEPLQNNNQLPEGLVTTQKNCLVSVQCERRSDKAKRTITVAELDTVQTICDKFCNELGSGDKFVGVYCCELDSALETKKSVVNSGLRDGYRLWFYRINSAAPL